MNSRSVLFDLEPGLTLRLAVATWPMTAPGIALKVFRSLWLCSFGIVNKDAWAPCWKEAMWEGLGDGVPPRGRGCGQESLVTTESDNQGHMGVGGLLEDPPAQPSINWLPPPEGFPWVAWGAGLSRPAPEAWEIGSHSGFMPLSFEAVCYAATASWNTCHLPDSRKSWRNSSGPPGHRYFDQLPFALSVLKFFMLCFS